MRRRAVPSPPTGVVRYYGKCTGNGPWHLVADRLGGQSRCGKQVRNHGTHYNPHGRICRPCLTIEQKL